MNKLILPVACVVGMLVIQACNSVCSCKQVSCPAYKNTNFDQWFPYQSAQQLVFADTAQQTSADTIVVNDVSARQSYDANKGCVNGDAGCSSDKYISAVSFSVSYNSSSDWEGVTLDSNYSLSLHDFSIAAKGINSSGFVNTTFPSEYYDNISLGGRNYTNVQTIFRTDTAGGHYDIYQIYLQKNTGLLAYRSAYTQALFVKK